MFALSFSFLREKKITLKENRKKKKEEHDYQQKLSASIILSYFF
jgi:hypothetical protein